METANNNKVLKPQSGVYPPSFCRWRLLLAVAAVTEVSVLVLCVGGLREISLVGIAVTSLYAQALALVCAMGV